jgi:phosphoribosylformylglycinamidine synthase
LISALGIVPDVRAAVTMDLKRAGNLLYVVGETRTALGGSLYYRLYDAMGNSLPKPLPSAIETMRALHSALCQRLVCACHDLSEGGLAVAAAEMAIAGRLGLELDLAPLPRTLDVETDDVALFAESNCRFLVEVAPIDAAAFEAEMSEQPVACVGRVTDDGVLQVRGLTGKAVIECDVSALRRAWQSADIL